MRITTIVAASILALLMSPAAWASPKYPLQLDAVRAQQAEIRAGAEAGNGRYKDMSATTRQQLFAEQAKVLKVIQGKQTENELTDTEKMQVFNALESIKAIFNKAEDERLVCTRERATGSNRFTSVCSTVAQMRDRRDKADKAKGVLHRRAACTTIGCGDRD